MTVRARLWAWLREPSPMHDNMRLIDLLPVVAIGLALLVVQIVLPVLGAWIVLIWFALAFISMWVTKRHVPMTGEGGSHD